MTNKHIVELLDERLLHLVTDYYKFSTYQHYADECRARMFEVCRIGYLSGVLTSDDYETIVATLAMIATGEPMEERL